ncbi:hypothetical protein HN011_003133 [Eciton burchellii]|nr:hypothetical protein HN011_003133 [Eciton burchellii]
MPNEISSDHNIIELDLDISTRPAIGKTKKTDIQPRKSGLGKATRRTNKNGTIKPFKKSERSRDRIYKLDNQGLRQDNPENTHKLMAGDNMVDFRSHKNEKTNTSV